MYIIIIPGAAAAKFHTNSGIACWHYKWWWQWRWYKGHELSKVQRYGTRSASARAPKGGAGNQGSGQATS